MEWQNEHISKQADDAEDFVSEELSEQVLTIKEELEEIIEEIELEIELGFEIDTAPTSELEPEPVFEPELELKLALEPEITPEDTFEFKRQDEIDWSQFVFSDEPLEHVDGLYYVSLYVNDFFQGSIEMKILNGQLLFNREQLALVLKSTLLQDFFV